MRVQVRSIDTSRDGATRVTFDALKGSATGIWKGRTAPERGRTYDIEFTIESPIVLGSNAERADEYQASVIAGDGYASLTGIVEGIDDDRIGYFRLAIDCLVLLDFADVSIAPGDWLTATIPVDELEIFPIGG